MDSIYALSANMNDENLNKLCNKVESRLDTTKSLAASSDNFRCTADISADTTKSPANKKIEPQRYASVRKKRDVLSPVFQKPDNKEKQDLQNFMTLYKSSADCESPQ